MGTALGRIDNKGIPSNVEISRADWFGVFCVCGKSRVAVGLGGGANRSSREVNDDIRTGGFVCVCVCVFFLGGGRERRGEIGRSPFGVRYYIGFVLLLRPLPFSNGDDHQSLIIGNCYMCILLLY